MLLAAVLGLYGLGTVARVSLWSGSEQVLWREATQVSPYKVRPWVNLGNAYAQAGEFDQAELAYRHAMQVAQHSSRGWDETVVGLAMAEVNLGITYMRAGRFREAKALIRLAAQRRPKSLEIREVAEWSEGFPD